jgi:hypothetical protein
MKEGHLNPITSTIREIANIFAELGFSVAQGPELEDEFHNFDALNIPKEQTFNIPKEYTDILNIFECGQDYGCATKFIPTILREDTKDTIIILLEDKYVYGKDFIETMIDEYNKNNCSIISNNGILLVPDFCDMDVFKRNNEKLDDNWIKNCIKVNKKNISYYENYKSFTY